MTREAEISRAMRVDRDSGEKTPAFIVTRIGGRKREKFGFTNKHQAIMFACKWICSEKKTVPFYRGVVH